jgi:hypothetical protein
MKEEDQILFLEVIEEEEEDIDINLFKQIIFYLI